MSGGLASSPGRAGPSRCSRGRSSRRSPAAPASRRAPAARSRPGRRRLGEGGERVGEEGDGAPSRPAASAPEPAHQRLALRTRGSGRCGAMPSRPSARAGRDRPGRLDSGAVADAEPVEPADRAEHRRAQRRAVDVVVVREGLGLQRAMSTLSGHSLLHALHIRQRSRISCSRSSPSAARGSGSAERLDQRVGAAARRVLLLARGHVRRAHDAGRRSCGRRRCSCSGRPPPRIPPTTPKSSGSQRAGRRQRGVAQVVGHRRRRRRSCPGSAGCRGSNSALTLRIAS